MRTSLRKDKKDKNIAKMTTKKWIRQNQPQTAQLTKMTKKCLRQNRPQTAQLTKMTKKCLRQNRPQTAQLTKMTKKCLRPNQPQTAQFRTSRQSQQQTSRRKSPILEDLKRDSSFKTLLPFILLN